MITYLQTSNVSINYLTFLTYISNVQEKQVKSKNWKKMLSYESVVH
jgi:hypothetical protein